MPAIANQFFLFQIFAWSFILGMIALSLMFLAGYGGMVSLMQMAVAGFAGYMVAMFGASASPGINLGWPWWLAAPTALALGMLFGAIGGALAVRTAGIYTIMITLAIAAAFYYFTNQNYAIFNGHTGINSVATPHFLGVDWRAPIPYYYLTLALAALCYFVVLYLGRTPFGLALQGVRDNPRRMAALGFNVYAHRVAAYAFASFVAALGGVLLVWMNGEIAPGTVSVDAAIDILIIAVVGGVTNPIGPFIGALIYAVLKTFALDILVSVGLRRQSVPPADRPRLPRHRVLLARRRRRPLEAMAQSPRGPARRPRRGAVTVMDSVAQRLSAVSSANALELRGVTRFFGALAALVDVSLTVRPGERRGVLGSNGAGKTTLFNCITGDFLPTSGTIRFFGEDVTSFPPYERIRRGLRRTYQISALFPGLSVLDNVYLACRGVSGVRYSVVRPGRNDALVHAADNLIQAVHLSPIKSRLVSVLATASSVSSRSPWRSPERPASFCSTSRPPGSRRPSAPNLSRSSPLSPHISATLSSNTTWTSRFASSRA